MMIISIINNSKFYFYNTFCITEFSKNTMIYPDGLTDVLPKSIYKNNELYDQYMIDNNLICVICFNELIAKKVSNTKNGFYTKYIKCLCIKNIEIPKKRTSISCIELPCKHIFHKSCLQDWFKYQKNCPTCKLEM